MANEKKHNTVEDEEITELEHLRKLFVGGLAPYTDEDALRTFYEQWGKVVDCVVMRDSGTNRSRGFGFVTYSKAYMVDKAQAARPHTISGKTVEAKRALPRLDRESRENNVTVKKLFVGGLKDNHDEECLREYFSQFGNILYVKILVDKATGKRRGFGYIEFDDYDAVDKAILKESHSIKYVLLDVKKSIYKYEVNKRNAANSGEQQSVTNGKGTDVVHNQNAPIPPQGAYPSVPPMNAYGPPPQNYNWGPPNYYNGYNQPPMNWNWNQPPNNGWNGPPSGPWHQGNYGPPPNWNWNNQMPPQNNWQNGPPPQQPPQQGLNFGSGYQQNAGGGKQKGNIGNDIRKNPYNAPSKGVDPPPSMMAMGDGDRRY